MDKTDKGRGGGIESEVPLYIWCGCADIRLLCGRRVEAHLRTFRAASVWAVSPSPAFSKTERISGYAGDSGSILVCFPRPGILVSLKLVPERPPEIRVHYQEQNRPMPEL